MPKSKKVSTPRKFGPSAPPKGILKRRHPKIRHKSLGLGPRLRQKKKVSFSLEIILKNQLKLLSSGSVVDRVK